MKSAYDIIKKPVLTEKSYAMMADKKFAFEVAINANKTEIKYAIEEIFEGVKVESVNTMRTIDLQDYDGLQYFQRLLSRAGIIDALVEAGVQEGDTVSMYDFEFDFVY